jgi:hypothetical protein
MPHASDLDPISTPQVFIHISIATPIAPAPRPENQFYLELSAVSEAKRLQIYNGYVQRPYTNGRKFQFGCGGYVTAVAAGRWPKAKGNGFILVPIYNKAGPFGCFYVSIATPVVSALKNYYI